MFSIRNKKLFTLFAIGFAAPIVLAVALNSFSLLAQDPTSNAAEILEEELQVIVDDIIQDVIKDIISQTIQDATLTNISRQLEDIIIEQATGEIFKIILNNSTLDGALGGLDALTTRSVFYT